MSIGKVIDKVIRCKAGIALALILSLLFGCRQYEVAAEKRTSEKIKMPTIGHQEKLYDVAVVGEEHAWVVGYFGAIFHTIDGGKSWLRKNSGVNNSLLGVSFANENEGWVVGEYGLILHTKDQGATWERQDSTVQNESLLKVQFVNDKKGWAVGTWGAILRTVDGGNTWERLPFEQDIVLNDLCFISEKEGWIVGEFETIVHTIDGGDTWDVQRSDGMIKLFGITMKKDGLRGMAVGTKGIMFSTRNGGMSWIRKEIPGEDTLLKVRYHNENKAIAVGLRGCLVNSSDDGESWSGYCIPSYFTWLSGIAMTEKGKGYLVGDAGSIYISMDRGEKWMPFQSLK